VFNPQYYGHVLVQTQGAPIALTLSLAGTSFSVDDLDDITWTEGNAGGLVLFTNLDAGVGTQAMMTSSSPFVGATALPVEPGALTITSIRSL
jgi:hypothetical protein